MHTLAVESPEDMMPIVYTSGSFSDIQQRWSATEKEALQSINLSLRLTFT